MKAAIYTRYGAADVVKIGHVQDPVPRPNQVLIRVYATTVSSGDWRARSLDMPPGFGPIGRLVFGVFGPRKNILGTELAGVVENIGDQVTKFAIGDAVVAYCGAAMGAHAELVCMNEDAAIAHKPANLTFEQAAALAFGGDTALDFLCNKGGLKSGERVLVNGASGATGSAAVQLARHFGAHVTGVTSTANVDLVRRLGAHEVIDYTTTDFARGEKPYDIIVDTVGNAPWKRSKPMLGDTGRLLLIAGSLRDMLSASFVSRKGGKKLVAGVAMGSAENLHTLVKLARSGAFTPLVERSYPFDQIARAHAHVETGRKKGSVVVCLVPAPGARAAI